MKLNPDNVAVGQNVSIAIMGDTYDRVIESASASRKTIVLDSGQTARWNAKRNRYQIGSADSRGYAMTVINRVASRLDPHV